VHGSISPALSPALICLRWQSGASPVYIASVNGHVDMVRLLIGARADIDARDEVPAHITHTHTHGSGWGGVAALLGSISGAAAHWQGARGRVRRLGPATGGRRQTVPVTVRRQRRGRRAGRLRACGPCGSVSCFSARRSALHGWSRCWGARRMNMGTVAFSRLIPCVGLFALADWSLAGLHSLGEGARGRGPPLDRRPRGHRCKDAGTYAHTQTHARAHTPAHTHTLGSWMGGTPAVARAA
jgi:hypothetical protein